MKLGSYQVDGINIAYAEYGKGTAGTVVLFSGIIASIKSTFFKQLENLPQRIIILGRPGYGETTFFEMEKILDFAIKLDGFFDSIGVDKFSVVGISAGAPYAHATAFYFKDRVEKLLIAAGITEVYKPEHMKLYSKENQEFYQKIEGKTFVEAGKIVSDIYEKSFNEKSRQTIDYKDSFQNNCVNLGQEALLQIKPWGFDISEIRCSITFLQGTRDHEVGYQSVIKTTENMSNAKLLIFKFAGHLSIRIYGRLKSLVKKL
ncbi:MAG: alpha/beta hydrolase [Spirochaetales bacterium]